MVAQFSPILMSIRQALQLFIQHKAKLAPVSTPLPAPVPPVDKPIREELTQRTIPNIDNCSSLGVPLVQLRNNLCYNGRGASLGSTRGLWEFPKAFCSPIIALWHQESHSPMEQRIKESSYCRMWINCLLRKIEDTPTIHTIARRAKI